MKGFSRNYGVDLLRIVSMVGVVFLHILGHGGLLSISQSLDKFSTVWFFEILAFPAVNCFMLVSGYVGYKGENVTPKIKNILFLWFTVLFYSITIFFLFLLFGAEQLGINQLIKTFMPTITGSYWFFTAYFGLFLLSPVLNLFVHKSNLKQAFVFLLVLSLFSVVSLTCDTFSLLDGYSIIWFVFVYLTGAVVKKYDLDKVVSKKIWLIIVLSAFVITWLSKVVLFFSDVPFLHNNSGIFVNYISPTIIIMAIGLLCLFSNIKIPSSCYKPISFVATSAFSVYLIHDNVLVRKHLITKVYTLVGSFNPVLLALSIIGIVLAIFVFCILVDKIRIWLFNIFKINKVSEYIESIIKSKVDSAYKKIKNKV